MVESLTSFVVLAPLAHKTAANTAELFLSRVLTVFGGPATITTDQGPEWAGEFGQLLINWGIDHRHTARNHPQANGKAERMVQTVKNLLRRCMLDPSRPRSAWQELY